MDLMVNCCQFFRPFYMIVHKECVSVTVFQGVLRSLVGSLRGVFSDPCFLLSSSMTWLTFLLTTSPLNFLQMTQNFIRSLDPTSNLILCRAVLICCVSGLLIGSSRYQFLSVISLIFILK